jgi:hypothetical protein
LIAIVLLCVYDFHLRGRLNFYLFLPIFLIAAIFADTLGIVAVLVVIIWSFVLSLLKQESWKNSLILLMCFLVLLLMQYLILGKGIGGVQSLSKAFLALLKDPLGILHSLLSGFAQPLLDKVLLQTLKISSGYFWQWRTAVGLAGLVISLTSLWFYWRAEGWRKSHMPVLLMLFGLVAWSTILLSRYLDGGANVFDDTRRFMRYFATYYMGVGFALSLSQGRAAWRAGCVFFSIIFTCFVLASYIQYKHAVHVSAFFNNAEAALKGEPFDEEVFRKYFVLCRPGLCESSIAYLRKNQLSVFYSDQH